MNVEKVKKTEDIFFNTLINCNGVTFKKLGFITLGKYTINKLRSDDNYYYKEETKKNMIVLHSTIGNIKGDMGALTKAEKVSVSYVVDRSGHIYELFDPKYWSYHLGMGSVGGNKSNSSRSIGIELSNYGPLTLRGSNLETVYSQVSYKDAGVLKKAPLDVYCTVNQTDSYIKLPTPFRGNSYFASYSQPQYEALKELLEYICTTYSIPKTFIPIEKRYDIFATPEEASSFSGITSHVNYRPSGKWDIGPDFNWDKIEKDVVDGQEPVDQPVPTQPEPVVSHVQPITEPVAQPQKRPVEIIKPVVNTSVIPSIIQPIQWFGNTNDYIGVLKSDVDVIAKPKSVVSWFGKLFK